MHALQAELFDETPELRTTLAFVVLQEARLRSIGYCVRDRVQAACRFAIKRHAVSSGLLLRDQAACSFGIKRDAAACRFAKHTCISLPTASCQAYLMMEMLPEGVLFPPIGEHYTHHVFRLVLWTMFTYSAAVDERTFEERMLGSLVQTVWHANQRMLTDISPPWISQNAMRSIIRRRRRGRSVAR